MFAFTSLKAPLIWAACPSYALFRSRLTAATGVSAALISLAWLLAWVASASISCRYFEAASANDKHLWPLCLRVTQSLHTTWLHSSSKKRYCSLCSGQKTGTAASFGLAFSSSSETTQCSRAVLWRVCQRAASLHISSLQSKQQDVARCFSSSQTSQRRKSPLPSAGVCGVACRTSSRAKFFGSPVTPAGTDTALLQVGQLITYSMNNFSKQLEQKLWPQLSKRGQSFSSSKRSQQIEHSSPSDVIVWKNRNTNKSSIKWNHS